MQRVALVLPTHWDRLQLRRCAATWQDRVEIVEVGPDDDQVPWDLDHARFVDDAVERAPLHGVFSSSDLPGAALAAAIAERLDLPGAGAANVLGASNKLNVRRRLQSLCPEATVRFQPVDPEQRDLPDPPWPWPGAAFCKPVRGSFSRHAALVRDAGELRRHLDRPEVLEFLRYWLHPYHEMRELWAPHLPRADRFLLEEPLRGQLVTVEGFVAGGRAHVLGVVDSSRDPRKGSFVRFDYPSALPERVQQRMADVATRLAEHLALDQTLFNVELFHDEATDRTAVVEINPRMCGQFADLYEKVDGVSSYTVALQLALGESPRPVRREGRFAAAASVPLRVFSPCRVVAAPSPQQVAALERELPGTLILAEAKCGDALTDFAAEDGASIRYAVVNAGGDDRDAVAERAAQAAAALGYEFARS